MSRLTIRLLGTPFFAFDGKPFRFAAPPRALPLLALLTLRRTPVSRAALAAGIWPDELDGDARANLRRHLHRIRRALPELPGVAWILEEGGTVAWNAAAPASVDLTTFEARIADAATRRAALAEAGELLEGCEDEWLVIERERLRALVHDALLEEASAARHARDFAGAIEHASKLLQGDAWREDALRELMAARYEHGDASGALAAYTAFAARLDAELRTEPMAETRALRDAIAAGLPLARDGAYAGSGAERDDDTPFVGRAEELERLRHAWSRAARGFGTTIFIAGEAGIGKSRLAAELCALAESQGGRAVAGATGQPEGTPYQALVAAAQRAVPWLGAERIDDPWAAALATVLPELRAIRPGLPSLEELDERRARLRLHDAFARFFDAVARTRPLVVVVEDLHWARADTLEAFEALARRASGAPVLLVATYRSEEVAGAHPLRAVVRALTGEHRATRFSPPPLGVDEIADLVARTPSLGEVPRELAERVAALSEGNPLFAWQLVRGFAETRELPDGEGAARSVGATIGARLDRLPREVRAVADVAATVGREFTLDLVAAGGGFPAHAVENAVDELVARRLVRESHAGAIGYAFAHALIATTAYALTAPAARPGRHRRIAAALDADAAHDRAALGVVARHWELAGERERAQRAYQRAAEAAFAVYARDEARRYARTAAELAGDDAARFAALRIACAAAERRADSGAWREDLERLETAAAGLGDAERFAALEAWEVFHARAGDRAAQRALLDALDAIARRTGDPRQDVVVRLQRCQSLIASGLATEAVVALKESVARADALADPLLRATARQRLVTALIRTGALRDATAELERLHATLPPDASALERLAVIGGEASIAAMTEDAAACRAVGETQRRLAQRVGDVDTEAKAHGLLAFAAHQLGDAAAMREHYDTALLAFERLGEQHALLVTLSNRGALERELGRLDEGLRFTKRAESLARTTEIRDALAVALTNHADIALAQGDANAAAAIAAEGLAAARTCGEQRLVAEALVVAGAAACARGETAEGIARLREGVAIQRTTGATRSLADHLCALIEALLDAGEIDAAAEAARELDALDVAVVTCRYPARVHVALGRAAFARGETREAARRFADGRRALDARLATLDAADAAAYRALPFAARLLARSQNGAAERRAAQL